MLYCDTHAHIDFDNFDADRQEVIKKAKDAGLGFIINIGIDIETSQKSVYLVDENPGFIYAAAGLALIALSIGSSDCHLVNSGTNSCAEARSWTTIGNNNRSASSSWADNAIFCCAGVA